MLGVLVVNLGSELGVWQAMRAGSQVRYEDCLPGKV
jgi:hypothetical protein